jgi:hypothetical protein
VYCTNTTSNGPTFVAETGCGPCAIREEQVDILVRCGDVVGDDALEVQDVAVAEVVVGRAGEVVGGAVAADCHVEGEGLCRIARVRED